MGYRSEIVIGLTNKLFLQEKLKGTLPDLLGDPTERNGAMYWRFSGYKWYDSYDEIRTVDNWVQDMIAEADEHNAGKFEGPGQFIGFIRVGEEHADIDELGEPWELEMYVDTYIECPAN